MREETKMSKSKTRLGLIGLCVTAAMATMAFAASGAQASAWMINGANVTAENLSVTVTVNPDTLVKLLTTSGGAEVAVDCKTQEVTSAVVHKDGTADGTVEFTECTTFLNKAESPVCKPTNEPIKAGGKLEIVKHNHVLIEEEKEVGEEQTYVKATSTSGPFTTLEFGGECSLPEKVEITGTGWIVDCEGWKHGEKEELTHLIEEAMVPALALGGLKFGKNNASIDGSLTIEVKHEGEMVKFSVLG
jgi:hypothetical protein